MRELMTGRQWAVTILVWLGLWTVSIGILYLVWSHLGSIYY